MIVFCDANVLLDVLLPREQFYAPAARIWTLVEHGRVTGVVSALSCTNVYYLVRRVSSKAIAHRAVTNIVEFFQVASCDHQIMRQALGLNLPDFEDAVQACCAGRVKADALVTRDVAGFRGSPVPVMAPAEFLASLPPEFPASA